MYALPSKKESPVSSKEKKANKSKIAPVQMSFSGNRLTMNNNTKATQQTAAVGVQGVGSRLPHLDRIQKAFGHHDISHVKAYMGTEAKDASINIGAKAFAR
jgi:hypothetical protein